MFYSNHTAVITNNPRDRSCDRLSSCVVCACCVENSAIMRMTRRHRRADVRRLYAWRGDHGDASIGGSQARADAVQHREMRRTGGCSQRSWLIHLISWTLWSCFPGK